MVQNHPKILLLSGDAAETNLLERILGEHVNLHSIRTLLELQTVLEDGGYDALFCGWSFHQDTWNAALEWVQQRCPDLPVVIFSRAGGEREWIEVIKAGGFDLLVAPYLARTVIPVLEHAVASYQARRAHNAIPVPKVV